MDDYDKINKRMEEKIQSNNVEEPKKEQKYVGSLLFLLHLSLSFGLLWIAVGINAPMVWLVAMGFGIVFLVSITVYKNGNTGMAILLTLGSVFLVFFLLVATCFGALANIH